MHAVLCKCSCNRRNRCKRSLWTLTTQRVLLYKACSLNVKIQSKPLWYLFRHNGSSGSVCQNLQIKFTKSYKLNFHCSRTFLGCSSISGPVSSTIAIKTQNQICNPCSSLVTAVCGVLLRPPEHVYEC